MSGVFDWMTKQVLETYATLFTYERSELVNKKYSMWCERIEARLSRFYEERNKISNRCTTAVSGDISLAAQHFELRFIRVFCIPYQEDRTIAVCTS